MIKNENDAYEIFAKYLLTYAKSDEWEKLNLHIDIYHNMTRCFERLIFEEKEIDEYRTIPDDLSDLQMDAAFFLRNHIIKSTGNRIWGLTFNLYPDGKFEIEYDYNKPEDYEEMDEVITGEEINQTLMK